MDSIICLLNGISDVITSFIINLGIYKLISWIYLIVFVILFCISCFGRQLGVRRKYINFLLKIFEFGCKRIKKKREKHFPSQMSEEETESSEFSMDPLNNSSNDDHSLQNEAITESKSYQLDDILPYVTTGISTIVEDAITPHFVSEELPYWNLLSRTNTRSYEFISIRLTVFWVVGFVIRYCLLLPLRVIILCVGLVIFSLCTLAIGPFPDGPFKREMNSKICIACFDFVAGCLSLVATFHNIENKPMSGIAVANHTSPIDSMVLATDNCYDMVGQKHGGLIGLFMTLLSRSSCHIWFDRTESKDRNRVAKRLREHASNPDLPPVLIFPEGVCVNNTSVMQFKKGAFEAVDEIHPIAIKFDPRFGDAFWWQDHFFNYVLCMMTSWAIVCDVWYLPSMKREERESSIDYAKRVKSAIAIKGGLMDVSWDGFLKAKPVKDEWRQKYQSAFARHLLGKEGDEAPEDTTPEGALPEDTSPKDVFPQDITKDTNPKDATPKDATPKDATPKDATLKDATLKDATPKDATPKDATPKDATPKDATTMGIRLEDTTPMGIRLEDTTPMGIRLEDTATKKATPKEPVIKDTIPEYSPPKDTIPEGDAPKLPLLTPDPDHPNSSSEKPEKFRAE